MGVDSSTLMREARAILGHVKHGVIPDDVHDFLIGQIAGTLARYCDAPQPLTGDVVELVIAARVVAYEDQSQGALDRLDRASEAFADRVPWDNDPNDHLPSGEKPLSNPGER